MQLMKLSSPHTSLSFNPPFSITIYYADNTITTIEYLFCVYYVSGIGLSAFDIYYFIQSLQ